MPQYLITALGSYGDVHPMVGLGASLAARGHRVKVITNPYFEDVVAGAGLEFVPIGSRDDYIRLSQHPDLWHPTRGPRMVMKQAALRMLRPLYDKLLANFLPGETVLCAHFLDLASRIVSETHSAPVASILFAPGVLWSAYDTPRLKGALLGPGVPRWLKRLQFWTADKFLVQMLLGGELNRLRRELHLEPVKKIFSQWMFSGDLVLGLFPEWFAPRQPDWLPNFRAVGFPLWDSPGSVPISQNPRGLAHFAESSEQNVTVPLSVDGSRIGTVSPERKTGTDPLALNANIREFLAAGSPPIAFSPGSANREAHRFFESAVEACDRLGCRGILLTKYDHQLPASLPDSVRHFGFVPLSKLLPHTAAMVHHGGIGSCAQGLAAGVPHVVQPMSYDQFDNSQRLVRLGVASEVPVRQFTGRNVAGALAPLLDSPTVTAHCRQLATQCDGPASLAAACDALEQLASSRPNNI